MEKANMYEKLPDRPHISREEKIREYISSFEIPAANLLRQLESEITAGTYSHILGIDASGRIPALIVGKYISQRYKEKGLEPPVRFFSPPYYELNSTPQLISLKKTAEEIRQRGQKVLIVDDTLHKGISLRRATSLLRENNIPFDIGVFLAINQDAESIEKLEAALGAEGLYVGDHGREKNPLELVKDSSLHGVRKRSVYPRSEKNIVNQKELNQSRIAIAELVEELLTDDPDLEI